MRHILWNQYQRNKFYNEHLLEMMKYNKCTQLKNICANKPLCKLFAYMKLKSPLKNYQGNNGYNNIA